MGPGVDYRFDDDTFAFPSFADASAPGKTAVANQADCKAVADFENHGFTVHKTEDILPGYPFKLRYRMGVADSEPTGVRGGICADSRG